MSNKVIFEVFVDDNGTLKAATAGVRGLGAEVEKTASAHKRAGKEADTHFNRQEKGVIGTANSTKSFAKLRQTLDGGSNSLVGAYATLAANIFAVSSAYLALKEAAQFQQIQAGLESIGNQSGTNLNKAARGVQELSGGLLTAQQAARSTAQTIAAGFSTKELERITVVARQASLTLGRDMTDSMDRLTRGIIKLEPELIDELGIMTRLDEASQIYAKTNNKVASALTVTEKRQAFLNAALAEGEAKFGSVAGNDSLNNIAKLGTAFQDLSKDVLNAVNVIAIPLAGVLDSKGLLIGGAVLFASTISKQLLPGLAQTAQNATKAAEALSAMASEQAAATKASRDRGGTTFSNLRKDLISGKATLEEIQIAQKNLTDSIAISEGKLSGVVQKRSGETEKAIVKSLALRRAELEIVRELTVAEGRAAAARASAAAVNQISAPVTGISGAIDNIKKSFNSISEATHAYNVSLVAAAGGSKALGSSSKVLSGILVGTRTAMFAASTSAKVLGAAFLEMIPVIGQAILVLTLAWEGLKFLYTKAVGESVIKAREDLKEATAKIKDYSAEIVKAKAANITASMQEQKIATITTNSIIELADAYNAVNEARRKKFEQDAKLNKSNNDAGNVGGFRAASITSIERFKPEAGKKQIEQLKALSPEVAATVQKYIELEGGINAVNASTEKQAKVIAAVRNQYENLGPAVENILSSFKALEDSYVSFIRSVTPSTPYDGLIQSLGTSRNALAELSGELAKGSISAEGVAKTLTGLGSNTLNQLPGTIREVVSAYKELQASRAALTALEAKGIKDGQQYVALKNSVKQAEQIIAVNARSAAAYAISAVYAEEEKLSKLQQQNITIQGQLSAAQAQLAVLSSYNDLSGKGTADRLKAENSIKALQAGQLQNQAQMVRGLIAQEEAVLRTLDYYKEQNTELRKLVESQGKLTALTELSNTIASATSTSEQKAEAQRQLQALQQQINAEQKIVQLRSSANSLEMQAKAAAAGMNSRAYIAAAKAATLAKSTAQIYGNIESTTAQSAKSMKLRNSLETELSGKARSSVLAYNELREEQEAITKSKIDSMKAQSAATIADLIAQRQLAKDKNSSDIESVRRYNILIQQEQKRLDNAIELLELENKYSLVQSIQIKSKEDLLSAQSELTNELLKGVEASKNYIDSEIELVKLKKKMELGRDLTDIEEAKISAVYQQKRVEAVEAEYTLKITLIDLEFELLKTKLEVSREELELQREVKKEAGMSILAEEAALEKYNKLLGKKPVPITPTKDGTESGNVVDPVAILASTKSKGAITELQDMAKEALKAATDVSKLNIVLGDMREGLSGGLVNIASLDKLNQTRTILMEFTDNLSSTVDALKSLGPGGEAVAALSSGVLTIADAFARFKTESVNLKAAKETLAAAELTGSQEMVEKANSQIKLAMSNQIAAVGAAMSQISSIYSTASSAAISAIDQQIAAEQKRDGKSAESVARIAALEKKKDAMAKKAFEVNKKLQMAQTVVNTASAIMGALATYPGPAGIALSAMFGALGAAQLALIAGTSYQSSSSSASASQPAAVSIGKRSDSVDLAKSNMSAGGELGYLTGAQGYGTNSNNFQRAAYGGRAGVVVGEKGPELFVPDTSGTIVSNGDTKAIAPNLNATIQINAVDAEGVEKVLYKNRGTIISMLREAANSTGQPFMESVNTTQYERAKRL